MKPGRETVDQLGHEDYKTYFTNLMDRVERETKYKLTVKHSCQRLWSWDTDIHCVTDVSQIHETIEYYARDIS